MTEKEKGVIEHANLIIKEGLDREDDIQGILKKLLNLIKKQQAEIEKKDKMIDLMANNIASSDSDLCQYIDETIRCKYYAGENKKLCDDCIKQYFEKQVESEDKQC